MAQDIGLLLRGLGAAVSNQVPQFRQQMAQEQEARMRQQELEAAQAQRAQQAQMQNFEMLRSLESASFQDAFALGELLRPEVMNIEGAIGLLEDRMGLMRELGVKLPNDPTPMLYQTLRRYAGSGDPSALSTARNTTGALVAMGVARGDIKLPEAAAPKPLTESNIIETAEGPMIAMQQPDGTVKMVPAGFTLAAKPPEERKPFQESGELRREFSAIPVVRDFAQQSTAMGRIIASAEEPSAAGDMSLVFNFMKVLDPGSTVREGEYANAQNAGGIDDKIIATYNRMVDGEILTESQRADFVNRAQRLYKSAEAGFMRTYNQYKNIASRRGLPLDDVLIDYRIGQINSTSQNDNATQSRATREANWGDM